MAKGGSGDVLAGMILSLLGQGIPPKQAVPAAVWLHGAAGDLAAKDFGEYGMTPSDLLRRIPADHSAGHGRSGVKTGKEALPLRRQTLCIPLIPLVLFLCLSACQGSVQENNLALALRADFLAMDGCSGTMDITADYGERVYAYTVSFSSTQETGMTMVITAPQEVAGITATIAEGQTYLTFDGVQLETGPLNEEGLSPPRCIACVSHCHAVWIHGGNRRRTSGRDGNPPHLPPGARAGTWSRNRDDPVVRPSHPKTYCKGSFAAEGTTVVRCVFSSFALTQKTTEKG